ncbi:Relaxase/Mobilisation nuclease domain-containing protein [Eubacterium pyruvativorans]|uniref:Relaxase/Mobilisation nuclease domain-containing protein n=1 Tax=Eubacterium pyruvativorans TaxID=155865 RepID=A0A1I7I465_9FIRM|nr:relaxase/mobilization nuclease domain-containing protein [Eubacterium pyruvativorans]SFO37260.1 Relaxase/Mobilisation nuclease domain-containing protein [Eubacterium pyruvativorans]SFU67732.1 Relaxase/Mobilisation nuclease domain-containing protein [Eubacterium pyruvativorans]
MAVTKIKRIRGNPGNPLSYIGNPEKTRNRDFSEADRQALADIIAYAADEKKTEKQYFTTGINCDVENAREQFNITKLSFNKTGGIVCGHCMQSFDGYEVTPEEAHEIGVQMAKELWGDRFQVVVATHLNTNNVHNHIVFNSVSFVDGKRFHFCTEETMRIRAVSDRICRERNLSVIEHPEGKRVPYSLYKMEKAGMPTRYNVARQALDEAISVSANMEEFKSELKKRGYLYQFNPRRKYWTVTPPGWTKAIRTDRLGDQYTREMIQQRVFSNDIGVRMQRMRNECRSTNHYDLKRRIDKIMGRSGLEKLYLRYCYELGYLPKYRQNPMRLHAVLKEELLKCDLYSEEAKFLARYNISTEEDLEKKMKSMMEDYSSISAQRSELRQKLRRKMPVEEEAQCREKVRELTAELKDTRKELKLCRDIRERSGQIERNLETVIEDRTRGKERKPL